MACGRLLKFPCRFLKKAHEPDFFMKSFLIIFFLLLPTSRRATPFIASASLSSEDVSDAFVIQVVDKEVFLNPEILKDSEVNWSPNLK
jgi:hypothetical protein